MHTQDLFLPQITSEPRRPNPRRYTTQRGTGPEALEVKRRLGSFIACQSPVFQLLRDCFPDATKNELISVAKMTIFLVRQRFPSRPLPATFQNLDRVTRRSMDLIVKWYHDHWKIIEPVFWDIGLADYNFRPISKNSV